MNVYKDRGIRLNHEAFEEYNILFNQFPNTYRKIKGVYMIGNFYIGASRNMRARIVSHIAALKRGDHKNSNFINSFIMFYRTNGYIPINYLNEEPFSESFFIKKFKKMGYPLINSTNGRFYDKIYKNS